MADAPAPSVGARLCAGLASRPSLALGLIVALALALVASLVFYRGLGPLGPFAGDATSSGFRKGAKKAGRKRAAASSDDEGEDDAGDPETQRLIEAINRQAGAAAAP